MSMSFSLLVRKICAVFKLSSVNLNVNAVLSVSVILRVGLSVNVAAIVRNSSVSHC